jgi:exodeoxyribonuclease VII small subunit
MTTDPSPEGDRSAVPVSALSYTEASHELDEIVSYFEQREVDVDVLVARLERATTIVDELDRRLRRTRAQVEELVPRLQRVTDPEPTTGTAPPAGGRPEGETAGDESEVVPMEDEVVAFEEEVVVLDDERDRSDVGDRPPGLF